MHMPQCCREEFFKLIKLIQFPFLAFLTLHSLLREYIIGAHLNLIRRVGGIRKPTPSIIVANGYAITRLHERTTPHIACW